MAASVPPKLCTHAGAPTHPRRDLSCFLAVAEFFHMIEAMCRSIRGLDAPFGGLQVWRSSL